MTIRTDVRHIAKSLYASAAIDFDGNFVKAATKLIDQAQEIQRLEAANAALMREAWDWSKVLEAEIATNTALKKTNAELLTALEEIALAGMSSTGQETEEALHAWHARRAWKFIGIAARALAIAKHQKGQA